jgi:hypothetical protein
MSKCMPCQVGYHKGCNIRDFLGQCCCQRGASHTRTAAEEGSDE